MTNTGPVIPPDALRERLERSLGGTYVLGRELGGGGMSRVFLAEEVALGRKVVVKVLAPSLTGDLSTERFTREIRLSARLQHPAIVPVLSAGVADGMPYYTMPYVAGESLRHRIAAFPAGERLPLAQTTAVLRDVARALAFAHDLGVVHRDIKPENVLLTGDAAMVADFGVAKALDAARSEAGLLPAATLTQVGSSLGTPAYMSPEQAAGDPALDARSDLYSFGVLAYELLAGAHPFAHRHSVQAMITAHLAEAPRPLDDAAPGTPPLLTDLVMRCLAKNAADRPVSANLLVGALTTHRDAPPPNRARTTSPSVKALGSVSRRRDIMVAVVLVTLAGGVAATVKALRSRDAIAPAGPAVWVNSAGYDDFLRGRVKASAENRQDNEEAIRYLRQAVAADPNLAPAFAELSRAYTIRAFYFASDSEKTRLIEDAEIAVGRALDLSPNLAEGWSAKGLMLWTPGRLFPHDLAIAAYRRALSFNPRLDEAHHQLAVVLLHVGLLHEARAHVDSALAINPSNTLARFRYGVIYMYLGDYEQADAFFRSTPPGRNPSLWGFQQASALLRLGKSDSASAIVSRLLADNPKDEGGVGHSVLAMIAAKSGARAAADSAMKRAVDLGRTFGHFHHTAFNMAVAETLLGRKARAIDLLEQAAVQGFPCYPLFESDTELAPLRSEPRFISLLQRIHIERERYRRLLNVQ